MLDTYEETQSRGAYQASTQPAMPITAPHQALPGYLQTPPTNPRRSNGMRTGAIVTLSLVLLLVLGVGLFAGWQFGRTSTNSGGVTHEGGTGPQSTVPSRLATTNRLCAKQCLPKCARQSSR